MPHLILPNHLQSIAAEMLIHPENCPLRIIEVHLMMRDFPENWNLILEEEERNIEIYHLGPMNMDKRESTMIQNIGILIWMTTGYFHQTHETDLGS
jgi:hypothetical protein